ncbi:MAG: glycosyltransferase family 39 protein [Gemmataceae bacterium]
MPLRQPALARLFPDHLCPWLAFLLIGLAAAHHLFYLSQGGPLDLAPDEAHYWDWSRHLDWSYYSKGPLVAWSIRASCELLGGWSERVTGNLTFAIRLPAVIYGSLLLASFYVLAVQVLGRPRLGLALVAGGLTVPLITAASFLITIDSPYTCCWGWALVCAYRAVTRDELWAWAATGVLIGVGILAKYTMVLFPVSLALFLLFSPELRGRLFSVGFVTMGVLALLCCVPILIWNAQHDWVTFLHVRRLAGVQAAGEQSLRSGPSFRWYGPFVYLGGQAALLMGYWFAVWLIAMIACNPWRQRDLGLRYLWWLSAPVFLLFLGFSFKTGGGEPNWPVTAYLSGAVLAGWWLAQQLESPRVFYRRATLAAVSAMLLLGLSLTVLMHNTHWVHPLMEKLAGPPTAMQPYPVRKIDPTCRLRGWAYLGAELDALREKLQAEDGQEPILAGYSWSVPGALGVYCAGHPQAYSVGILQGDRHSQYDLWHNPIDDPEPFRGRTFVIVGPLGPATLAGFERVEEPRMVEYREHGRILAGWPVFVCRNFKGFTRPTGAPH